MEILTEEGCLDCFAQFGERQVSWILEVVAREALEYRFGLLDVCPQN